MWVELRFEEPRDSELSLDHLSNGGFLVYHYCDKLSSRRRDRNEQLGSKELALQFVLIAA